MNIGEVSFVFEGIVQGLGSGMKKADKDALVSLSAMFRRFSNQSVADFVKGVEGAFLKEKNSAPALVERIKAYKENRGEPHDELWKSLSGVAVPVLKAVIKGLNQKPATSKPANLQMLANYLTPESTSQEQSENGTAGEIEKAFEEYCAIRSRLNRLSIAEIRSQFAPIALQSKAVLAGVLDELGYPAVGNKDDLVKQLLGNLESTKVSLDQTSRIGTAEPVEELSLAH